MNLIGIIALVVALVAATLFIYPYLIYPISLMLLPARSIELAHSSGTDGSGFALFFCAYNEAKVIPEKLENLRALRARYPQLSIYAYDDSSTDGTLELLEAEPHLVNVVRGGGRTGKAHGMKRMVAACDATYLVFTDANVLLDLECIAELDRYYADASVGGICGSLHYIASEAATATEVTGGLYWRLEERTKGLESATGNVMGADGSIFSVRGSLYPTFPDTVQDDFTVSMSVVFSGQRLIKASSVIAYERLVAKSFDEAKRKVRIAARAYHTHSALRPGLRTMTPVDRYKYIGHKVLRWYGAVPLTIGFLGLVAAAAASGRAGVWAAAVIALLAIAARFLVKKFWEFGWELLAAVMCTFKGVIRARRGETYQTWTPPVSR